MRPLSILTTGAIAVATAMSFSSPTLADMPKFEPGYSATTGAYPPQFAQATPPAKVDDKKGQPAKVDDKAKKDDKAAAKDKPKAVTKPTKPRVATRSAPKPASAPPAAPPPAAAAPPPTPKKMGSVDRGLYRAWFCILDGGASVRPKGCSTL